jgi:hypothetical protein
VWEARTSRFRAGRIADIADPVQVVRFPDATSRTGR